MIRVFLVDCDQLWGLIRRAISEHDHDGLRTSAHTLKGMLGTVSASSASALALELENMGISGDLNGADQLLHVMELELRRIQSELSLRLQPLGDDGTN